MRNTLGKLLTASLLAACSTPATDRTEQVATNVPAPLPLLERLPGHWVHQDAGSDYRFEEHWTNSADGSLEGLGVVRSGNDTVMIEHLRILETDSGIWYSAQIPTQNNGTPVLFHLEHEADSLVFANAEHDFPQRIAYLPSAEGGWHVHLSGMRNDTAVFEELRFVRVQDTLITMP